MRLVSPVVLIYLCKTLCSALRGERSGERWGTFKTCPPSSCLRSLRTFFSLEGGVRDIQEHSPLWAAPV